MKPEQFKKAKRLTALLLNTMQGKVRGQELRLDEMGHPALASFGIEPSELRIVLSAVAAHMVEEGGKGPNVDLSELTDEQLKGVIALVGAGVQIGISAGAELLIRIQEDELDADDAEIEEVDKLGEALGIIPKTEEAEEKPATWHAPVWGHHD